MNYAELRAELEADRAWREAEVRELQNRASTLSEPEQDRFRRAIILLLYAHYEGFCKFAFQLYLNAINQENLRFDEVTNAVAVAAMTDVLSQLSDPNKRTEFFRNTLPEDAKLHRFARQREFLQRFEEMRGSILSIPEEAIDLESNLKPIVLKKNLYLLGLDADRFEVFAGSVHQLLKARNDIAHGASKQGIDRQTYSRLRTCSTKIMSGITQQISGALASQEFRKRQAIVL